jgi:hypothetical protein
MKLFTLLAISFITLQSYALDTYICKFDGVTTSDDGQNEFSGKLTLIIDGKEVYTIRTMDDLAWKTNYKVLENNGDILTAIIEQTSHTNTGVLSFGGKNNPVLSFAGVANVMGSGSYGKCKPPM